MKEPALYNKILYLLFFVFTSVFKLTSQTIWSETFSNGCASGCLATSYGGWTETATGVNDASANIWYISGEECGNSVGTCGTACGSTDPSLHLGSSTLGDLGAAYDAGGLCGFGICVTTNKRIQSPVINCTGYSNIILSFNFIHNGNDGSNDECSVWYFDGTTWNNLGVLPRTVGVCSPQGYWTNYSIQLPASANNNPNVRIGFNWKNNDNGVGTDPSVAIDDIVLYVKQVSCYNSAFAAYTGAGCTANCNLSEYVGFSSMCNGTSVGCGTICPTTGPVLSQLFTIPAGCTATLTAAFQRICNGIGCSVCSNTCNIMNSSNGCCNSGMDANDYFKVGGSLAPVSTTTINLSPGYTSACGGGAATTAFSTSGNTITATGTNNGGAIIQYVQTGGVLFLEGRANRMDEIITYTLDIQAGCNCVDVLPVDIFSFNAKPKNGYIELSWITKNELHLSHYKIEKSTNGVNFTTILTVPSENVYYEKIYSAADDNPVVGISYYKLTPVNISGEDEKFIIRDVLYQLEYNPFTYSIKNDELVLQFTDYENPTSFIITDLNGKVVYKIPEINQSQYNINKNELSNGVYVGVLSNRYQTLAYKIIVL